MSAPIEQGLLPCPFCGGDFLISGLGFIVCRVCDAQGPHAPNKAAERWNTRVTPKPSGEVNLSLNDEYLGYILSALAYAKLNDLYTDPDISDEIIKLIYSKVTEIRT